MTLNLTFYWVTISCNEMSTFVTHLSFFAIRNPWFYCKMIWTFRLITRRS